MLSIFLQTPIQAASGWQIFLSVFPVFLLIILMGFLKLSGDKSAFFTLIATVLIALIAFHFPLKDTGLSVAYGILKAVFPILIIIVMAIFSYNVLVMTGKMEVIKQQFISISSEKAIQVLLLTWGFGGLLEGMAGFGTAVAIPAAMLISLGFDPIFAAVASLISNSVATGFGAVGIPVKVLAEQAGVTDITGISSHVVFQLSPLMIIIPFVLLYISDSKTSSIVKYIFLSILVGGISILVQFTCAHYMGAETPAILGSIASIITIIIYAKITERNKPKSQDSSINTTDGIKAWSVYGLILILVILTSPLLPFKEMLSPLLKTFFNFDVLNTATGQTSTHTIKIFWLVDTGVLLFIGAMVGGLIQGAGIRQLFKLLGKVILQQRKTFVTVCSLIALSSVMDFSGMIGIIGVALAYATGSFYPLFAPTIGCVGTFITGSDTSSNILFGKLQASVAHQIGMNKSWLAAANTAGSTGGKIISPQSIAVATSAIGQQGKEGEILKKSLPYALGYIIIAGLMVYFLPKLFTGLF